MFSPQTAGLSQRGGAAIALENEEAGVTYTPASLVTSFTRSTGAPARERQLRLELVAAAAALFANILRQLHYCSEYDKHWCFVRLLHYHSFSLCRLSLATSTVVL